MQRKLLTIVGAFGFVLLIAAAFLATDHLVTDAHRAGFKKGMDETFTSLEEVEGHGRAFRGIRGLGGLGKALSSNILDFETAELLPPAPEGWQARAYVPEHAYHIFGDISAAPDVAKLKLKWIQRRFEDDANRRKYGTAATYDHDGYLVILRLDGKIKGFRAMGGDGNQSKFLKASRFDLGNETLMTVDGIAINVSAPEDYHGHVPNFRLFSFGIGHLVQGEILTNAPDAHVADLMKGMQIAALQSLLPRATKDYRAGEGFVAYFEEADEEEAAQAEAG